MKGVPFLSKMVYGKGLDLWAEPGGTQKSFIRGGREIYFQAIPN